MKGPQGILAETIAVALADFFVIDQEAMETNLLDNAGIVLRNTTLKPQVVHLSPHITAQIEGVVQSVAFQWHWGQDSEEKGGSHWVKDVKLTIAGLNFTVILSEGPASPAQDASVEHDSKPEPPHEEAETTGFMTYVQDQVQRIIDTLELAITDLELRIQLPSKESLLIGGSGFNLKSLGVIQGEPLKQELECATLYSSVLHVDGSSFPLLEPISYKAECIRLFGKRFLGGIDRGLKVAGESTDEGIIINVGAEQIQFVNELIGLLLSIKPAETEESSNSTESTISSIEKSKESVGGDEHSSYFELPLSAISLVFPNDTKIALSGLVAKYQMDGSIMKVEGHNGILVDDFPVLKLGAASLWCLDLVASQFNLWNPEHNETTHDATVAFVHIRNDELQSVKDGLDEVLSILNCIENGAISVLVSNDDEPPPQPTASPPWFMQLEGRIGFLWEGDDDTIDAEFFVRDVAAISEPASVLITAIDQLYIPGILKLSKPIENTRITFDGLVVDIQIGDLIATLEEAAYAPPVEKQPTINESESFVSLESSSSMTDSSHASVTVAPTPFVMPFGVVATLQAVTLFKVDGQTTHLTVIDTHLALGPHRSLSQLRNQDFGGIRLALTMERIVMDMILVEKPRISAVIFLEDLDTIPRFSFQAKSIAVSAGYSALDWKRLRDFRGPKSKKKRQKIKKQTRNEPNKPIKLPFAHVKPLKVSVVVSSDLVGVKDSTMHFEAFQGRNSTTSDDLIGYYASRMISRVPNIIANTELFGTGVADAVAGSYGGATGAVTMSALGVAAGPLGGILGIAAFDGVRNTINAGKASRGADVNDRFQLLDLARGLKYAAVRATRGGASKRGKTDDQRGDPIDWAVGATSDVAKYTSKNKARLGSAGAGTVGFMYGMMFGGPVGAVLGAVTATVVAGKAINKVDTLANRSKRHKRVRGAKNLAIEAPAVKGAVPPAGVDQVAQGVEYTLTDLEDMQSADIEAANSVEVCLEDNPIPVRGVLLKRREFCIWDWRAHYFVLDEGELQYFQISLTPPQGTTTQETTAEPEGVLYIDTKEPRKLLNVSGLSANVDDGLSKPSEQLFVFTISYTGRQDVLWVLAAASNETRDRWVTQIQRHGGKAL